MEAKTVESLAVEELFPGQTPTIYEMIRRLRKMALSSVPNAAETFHCGNLSYGPTASGHDRVLYIAVQNGYVNLGFFYGDHLSSSQVKIEGTGKRMRHVKVRSVEEAGYAELPTLLKEAWREGVARLAEAKEAGRKGRG